MVKVPVLPPLQPNATSLDKNMMKLFGVDDDRLLKNEALMNNNDRNENNELTPFAKTVHCSITVRCSFLPFTYDVINDVALASLTATHMFEKVKKTGQLF